MIIGLAGYARSGKDTVAQILVTERGYRRLAFADALKAVLQDLDPWVGAHTRLAHDLHGHDNPTFPVNGQTGWEYAKQRPEVRQLLQRLGVACRDHLGPDVWVDAVFRHIQHRFDEGGGCRWVIPDVRFPNEAAAVKAHGGQVWRVVRPGTEPVNGHVSETALDGYGWDQIVVNGGSLADLRRDVLELVDTIAPAQAA